MCVLRCSVSLILGSHRLIRPAVLPRVPCRASFMAGTTTLHPRAHAVLDYWLGTGWPTAPITYLPADQKVKWFMGGPKVDKEIMELFGEDCEALAQGAYDDWQHDVHGCLAGIIMGDQLCRNVYRGTPGMFKNDPKVLAWAKSLVAGSGVTSLKPIERVWVFMPYMHSETLEDQQECVRLFEELVGECEQLEGGQTLAKMCSENVKYAMLHRDVVARWGRFPHRNATLGRSSTPEEAAGLADGTIPKF